MTDDSNPVNWFEIATREIDRAARFYETVFETKLKQTSAGDKRYAWFPGSDRNPGSTGALVRADDYRPSHDGALVYLHVDDIDATLARVPEAGGRILSPRRNVGEHGVIAHVEDTEGNRIGIHARR